MGNSKATNHLDQFTPTELAVSIDAITYLGLDDSHESQAFGNAWMAAATQQLKKFTSEDLAMSIEAIVSLEYSESREFEHSWIQTAIQKLGHVFNMLIRV